MTKSVRFANTITALFSRGGVGKSVSYLLVAVLVLGAASARADVVDLGDETISKTGAEFKDDYNNNTIVNGTVNVSTFAENTGTYTIGVDALVQCSEQQYFNGDFTINIERGGEYRQTSSFFEMPFRFGQDVLTIDGGKFTSTAPAAGPANGGVVNFGYVWNNKDSSKNKDISATVVMKNDAELSISAGNLQLGSRKSDNEKGTPVKTVKMDFFVTNSTVKCEAGDINLGYTTSKYISDLGNSYINVVFGPGSHIHFRQMYVQPYPAPSVVFDGATIHKVPGGYSSFIGHNPALGDIYTIDAGGLTIDIPSDVALTCDQNASSLKGAGGVTKIGEGSITWNQVSSCGSQGMTFTGPLVVSNGTWTSSLSYAASAFKVDGSSSTLALSGALSATDVAFEATDGGTLTLAGAAVTDATPDLTLASNGKTDYFTRDGAVDAYTLGTLTLGEGVTLALDGGSAGVDTISATALALSATAANKVTIGFSDAANVLGGTHDLVALTGGSTFATGDLAKFALDENLPEGSVLSLSEDLTRLVLTVPASNPATWTGGANDNNLLSPMNWLGKVVPGSDADVIISVDSATTLMCNDAFSVNSISFTSASAQVTISGSGCITNATEIVNASEARPVINVPVEFVANDAYAAIDVTGEVDFAGSVKGTVPANHSTFYGNYTLTATSWRLSDAITLAANATVTANDMTLNTAATGLLNAESGSLLSINKYTPSVSGDFFGSFAGTFAPTSIELTNQKLSYNFNSGFSGVLRTGYILYFCNNATYDFIFDPAPSATIVVGGNGITAKRGIFYLRKSAATSPLVLRSSGDWSFDMVNHGYKQDNRALVIGSSSVDVDTSDFDDPSVAHTVTAKNSSSDSPDRLLEGNGAMSAFGNGIFYFKDTAQFTGGFTASNSVNVGVNAGVYPGKGNVSIRDSAVFRMRQSDSGTVPVSGTLTMSGGTTLRIPTLVSGVLPLSVNALAFDGVTAQSKVKLEINGGTLANGYYAILKSATTLPADAVEAFVLDVNEAVELPAGAETSLVAQGDTLFLQVGDVSELPSGVWVGGVDTDMSNRLNWKNWTVPAAGSDLDFSGVSSAATVNADIDAAFGAVTMGTGVVTFTGALTATSFSDTSKVAVGADATVTLDGDLALDDQPTDILVGRVDAGGQFIVTGNVVANDKNINPVGAAGSGYIVVGGLQVNGSDKWLYSTKDRTSQNWAFGPGGISGAGGIWCRSNNANDSYFHVYTNDFKISVNTVIRSAVDHHELNTTGFHDSLPHTITLEGGLADKGQLFIAGTGKVVVDSVPVAFGGYPAYSGAVTVKDTATLAVNDGKMISTGTITVNPGAALQVAQSGTVALGGGLTLDNGAVLAFNYTGRAEPVLALEGKTVTFEEGETTNVTVRISADAGARAHGGKNVLTTGGKFADVTVTLAEGAPSWASDVTVENGEIVLSVKPVGLAVFVR